MTSTLAPATETAELTREDLKVIPQVTAPPRVGRRSRAAIGFIASAAASVVLYGLFFGFIDDIFPRLTSGTIGGAAAVIGLALTFSLIHGNFGAALLEILGIRELKKG